MAARRIRITLTDKFPHYIRAPGTGIPCCNACLVQFSSARTDDDLRSLVHKPTWLQHGWKTLLCQSCAQRRAQMTDAIQRVDDDDDEDCAGGFCISCLRTSDTLLQLSTKYKKRVDLCPECATACAAQLVKITSYLDRFSAALRAVCARLHAKKRTRPAAAEPLQKVNQ
jgi:hypothetical protein